MGVPAWASYLAAFGALLGLAILPHWKALGCDLIFDDQFAIIGNADVLGQTPWSSLLQHDFWGQQITSASSHKSYRPLTVSVWRLWHRLEGGPTPHANWFHRLNLGVHAVVTIQVFNFARRFFQIFDQPFPPLRGFVAAALFAVHPVHSEAVVGAVGFAELLCASLGILGLHTLLFNRESNIFWKATWLNGLLRVGTGCILVFLATFAKEVGITSFGTIILWDAIVVPLLFARRHNANRCHILDEQDEQTRNMDECTRDRHQAKANRHGFSRRLQVIICVRVLAAVFCVGFYKFHVRQRVAGGQDLVTMFRRTENPFAYAPSRLIKILSVLANHGAYAILLVFPRDLSCDWSFACTSYVEYLHDVRNLLSLALYLYFATIIARAHPARILLRLCGHLDAFKKEDVDGVRQAFLSLGLVIIPFLPASNIFFWVGTALGERLLYYPSVGYVMLVADSLLPQKIERQAGVRPSIYRLSFCVRLVISSVMIFAFTNRSRARVLDWQNEATLFEAAHQVCPSSVKVLENVAILKQRTDLKSALNLFRTAQHIDPSSCDVKFLEGDTLIRMLDVASGLPRIREAARTCQTKRSQALNILMQLVRGYDLKNPDPQHISILQDVAVSFLNEDGNGDAAQGCDYMEHAMWGYYTRHKGGVHGVSARQLRREINHSYAQCKHALLSLCVNSFGKPEKDVSLLKCYEDRWLLADALAITDGKHSAKVRKAAHKYLHTTNLKQLCLRPPQSFSTEKLCSVESFSYKGSEGQESSVILDLPAWQGNISTGHRMAVHYAQARDEWDPWAQLAWGHVLVQEGRRAEASQHIKVAAQILAMALQGQTGDKNQDLSIFLQSPLAPKNPQEVLALAQRWEREAESLVLAKETSKQKIPRASVASGRQGKGGSNIKS